MKKGRFQARVLRALAWRNQLRRTTGVSACAGVVALCATAQALTPESRFDAPGSMPYQGIVERNVFALKPPPPPPDPNEKPSTPAPKITLTGITTLFGYKRALLKVPAQPGKPGDAGKAEQSSILKEGERDGELEVVSIDVENKKVEVSYNGQPVTVTFDKDAGKNMAGGTPVPAMGQPAGIPAPVGLPGGRPNPVGNPGFMPARPVRGFQPQGAGVNPAGAGGYGSPSVSAGGVSMPGFGTPGTETAQPRLEQTVGSQLSTEESMLMIEAQREQYKESGNPLANLMPITRATPAGAPGTLGGTDPSANPSAGGQQGRQRAVMPPVPPGMLPPGLRPQ